MTAMDQNFFGMILFLAATVPSFVSAAVPDFMERDISEFNEIRAPQSAQARLDMKNIPDGVYPIGRNEGPADEKPLHFVELSAFKLDRTEVTNEAFAEFLNALKLNMDDDFRSGQRVLGTQISTNARQLLTEGARGSGLYPIIALDDNEARIDYQQGRFMARKGYENHPVAETTWAGAKAYCEWRGDRLPSEVEWEAAARTTQGQLYPWGDKRPNRALVFVSKRSGETGPVGAHPKGASPFGVLDLSGSMAEWTSTLKRPYPYVANDGREDQNKSGERVTRGGDYVFDTDPETLTATHRNGFSNAPGRGHRHIGFRCAASHSP